MKLCAKCKEYKEDGDFNKNATKWDGLHSRCKTCTKNYYRAYYRRNPKPHILRAKRNSTKTIAENRRRVKEYLLSHPCVDCGEQDTVVLEFDHVRGRKVKEIGNMVGRGWAWASIQEEIEKCEVRCANDHRRRHRKEFKWQS